MRADRLERKTHFKRLASLPAADVTIYDLTGDAPGMMESYAFSRLLGMKDEQQDAAMLTQAMISATDVEDMLATVVAIVRHSPVARQLLHFASVRGWALGVTNLNNSGFFMDTAARTLMLDHFALAPAALGRSAFFRNALLTTLLRALREIEHAERYGDFDAAFGPEDVLMLERVRAADCDSVAILAGWELRAAGFADIWRHLLGSQEGDMGMVFTRALERDPTALFDGTALAHAFRQWYADDGRINGCDHQTLEALDDLLLGAAEDACANPFGASRLTAEMLEEIGTLPDGTPYLDGMGPSILRDPFYAGLGDPINQTHLFHLMYDLEVTMVNNVPFRDAHLAARIFPAGSLLDMTMEER